MSRSLAVPGSDSSELHRMYLVPGALGHEAPLQPGRETRAATAAQAGLLDHLDDVGRRDLLFEDPAQRAVATGLEVVLVRPRLVVVQRRVDDVVLLRGRTDRAVAFEYVRHAPRPYFRPSSSSSTFAASSFSW